MVCVVRTTFKGWLSLIQTRRVFNGTSFAVISTFCCYCRSTNYFGGGTVEIAVAFWTTVVASGLEGSRMELIRLEKVLEESKPIDSGTSVGWRGHESEQDKHQSDTQCFGPLVSHDGQRSRVNPGLMARKGYAG